eukprot:631012-Pleurochrysis_carterae.AAC.3
MLPLVLYLHVELHTSSSALSVHLRPAEHQVDLDSPSSRHVGHCNETAGVPAASGKAYTSHYILA